jgi:uncharacterized protein (DUF1330 family)
MQSALAQRIAARQLPLGLRYNANRESETMATYIIFTREEPIRDEAEMQAYRDTNAKGGRTEGMEALVAYGPITGLEGETPDGAVVLKFDTREAAMEWYNRPIYQEAIEHRKKAAHYRVFMVEGV